jgi:hypothetical protein
MRLAFGVRRLAFREMGIAHGEDNCSKNQTINYHHEAAIQRGSANRRTSNAKR